MNWFACRDGKKVGPLASRGEALRAFREAYPFKGKDYERCARKNQIVSGYGKDGPHFAIEWDDA